MVDLKLYRQVPEGDDLRGQEWERANKCSKCLGVLSAADGHYHSAAGGLAICCKCGYGGKCKAFGR